MTRTKLQETWWVNTKFKYKPEDCDYLDDYINFIEYENCCGAYLLTNFPTQSQANAVEYFRDDWYEQMRDWLDEQTYTNQLKRPKKPSNGFFLKIILEQITEKIHDKIKSNLDLVGNVILNETQKWIIPCLKKNGFRLVSDRTVNPDTENRLYVLIRDLLTPKGKTIKKRVFK